jgi:hypothetical protein
LDAGGAASSKFNRIYEVMDRINLYLIVVMGFFFFSERCLVNIIEEFVFLSNTTINTDYASGNVCMN